jgi:hypothetical protein
MLWVTGKSLYEGRDAVECFRAGLTLTFYMNPIPLNINPLVPISVDQEPTGKAIQPKGGGTNLPTNLIPVLSPSLLLAQQGQ